MTIVDFPPVDLADEDGLIGVGGDLDYESLLLAYRSGIFPWPFDDDLLAWFAPPHRAVIFLDEFHVSTKLRKILRRNTFSCSKDTQFPEVIQRCSEPLNRGSQKGTWITTGMIHAYTNLHERGYCHSFETYLGGELAGGVYGVQIGRFFAAESSFFRVPDASKVAMVFMADYLRTQGCRWFDCQVLTPFSESFGAREIPREEFMQLLHEALSS
jgi:leucyl/phenylalanyl-tRNA--protein transferase